jgi:hypothetical protein
MTQPAGNSTLDLTSFDDHQYHRWVNVHALEDSGSVIFDINLNRIRIQLPNMNLGTQVKLMITAASAAYTPPHFK